MQPAAAETLRAGDGSAPGAARALARVPGPALALAAVALGLALFVSDGAYHPLALAGVTLATLATLAALAALARGARGARAGRPLAGASAGRRGAIAVLAAGLAASFALDALFLPGVYVNPAALGGFRPLLLLLAALAATHAWEAPPAVDRARTALELATAAALGALVILASPAPAIDVWYVERIGADALLHGVNPYAIGYPNIYGPGTPFLARELLSPDGLHVLGNPYPPLSLLLVAPAVALAEDPRWAMLAAILFSAWALRRLGRGSRGASLASLFLLVQPRGLFVVEQAWTEPLVLAAVLGVCLVLAWVADRPAAVTAPAGAPAPGWVLLGVAGAVALGAKQYSPLLLAPLVAVAPRGTRLRAAALAVAGGVAVMLPFLIWDPPAFLRGVVTFQLLQPFRADALSWPAALLRTMGVRVPTWPAFLLAGGVVAFAVWRVRSLAGALTAAALAWLLFVGFNKQAFCNYYWLGVGLLCAAVAAAAREPVAQAGEADRAK